MWYADPMKRSRTVHLRHRRLLTTATVCALLLGLLSTLSPAQGPISAAPELPAFSPDLPLPGQPAGDWVESPVPGGAVRMAPAIRLCLERDILARVQARRFESALELLRALRRAEPENPQHPYNIACVKSLAGRPEEALDDLRTAIELGWVDFRFLERDMDLAAARALPAFEEIRALNAPTQRRLADERLAALRAQLGDGYLYETDPELRLVFAVGVDRPTYAALRDYLAQLARALQATIFQRGLEQYVMVVLPRPEVPLPEPVTGVYVYEYRVFVARTVGRELTHEFVHALHHADMDARGQRHPVWIAEGFAVLFESLHIEGDRLTLEHSERLNELQFFVRSGRTLSFEQLAALDSETIIRAARVAYPQAGYILRWLHDLGLLNRWYETYCESFDADPTGLKALERTLGRPLRDIEAEWQRWVLQLQPAAVRIGRHTPLLGVQTEAHTAGLRVLDVVSGSPAGLAGIAPGDILETVAGRRVTEPLQLVRLINEHASGDQVEVTFRRGAERRTVTVPLAKRFARPR